MMRSGRQNDFNELAEDGEGATADPVAKAGAKPGDRLDELTALVKSLMQSQATRDQRMDRESARQEQRWKSMQHQFQQIQPQVKMRREVNLMGAWSDWSADVVSAKTGTISPERSQVVATHSR